MKKYILFVIAIFSLAGTVFAGCPMFGADEEYGLGGGVNQVSYEKAEALLREYLDANMAGAAVDLMEKIEGADGRVLYRAEAAGYVFFVSSGGELMGPVEKAEYEEILRHHP